MADWLKGFSSGSVLFPSQMPVSAPNGNGTDNKEKDNGTNKRDPNSLDRLNTTGTLEKRKRFGGAYVNNAGSAPYISYPMARGAGENTGDTLRIKSIKYTAPPPGAGLSVKVSGVQGVTVGGEVRNITQADIEADKKRANPILTTIDEKTGKSTGKRKPIGIESNFKDANQRILENQTVNYYIELPAPQDIQDSNSVTWGEDTLNALELAALNVAGAAMQGGGNGAIQAAQTAVTALQTGVEFKDLEGNINQSIRAAISGAAVGALGGNVNAQSVIARSTGQILNSNTELLFQGVNLRSFPFTVTFTPRNPKEGLVVKAIIRSLKQSMAAKAGEGEFNGASANGIFLKSPDVFSLEYLRNGKPHPFLNAFKLCALTAMQVNYTNAGTYTTYDDGTPVAIRLNMTFKEINPIYNEDYDEFLSGPGVGY